MSLPDNFRGRDLTELQSGQLTVLGYSRPGKFSGQHFWHCRCTCGQLTEILGHNLISGNTQSCGCLRNGACRTSPAGVLLTKRLPAAELLALSVPYAEIVALRDEWRELHRIDAGLRSMRQRSVLWHENDVLPADLLGQVFPAEMFRPGADGLFGARQKLELALGYFLQSPRIDDLTAQELVGLLQLVAECPPFPSRMLKSLLQPVVQRLSEVS